MKVKDFMYADLAINAWGGAEVHEDPDNKSHYTLRYHGVDLDHELTFLSSANREVVIGTNDYQLSETFRSYLVIQVMRMQKLNEAKWGLRRVIGAVKLDLILWAWKKLAPQLLPSQNCARWTVF